jgi:hypothetical protein
MTPAPSIILRRICSSNILLHIVVLYYIYKSLENLLILLHDSSVINLGPFYTIFVLRQDLSSSFYNKVYLPLSPFVNAMVWGVAAKPLKLAMQSPTSTTFERFVAYGVVVAALGIFGVWLRTACYCAPSTRDDWVWRGAGYCTPIHSAAVFVFERPCIEAICGVALSIILMIASWWGWAWDFGIWDEVPWEDDKSSIRGAGK